MSYLQTSFIHTCMFTKTLTYRQLVYFRRNFHCVIKPDFRFVCFTLGKQKSIHIHKNKVFSKEDTERNQRISQCAAHLKDENNVGSFEFKNIQKPSGTNSFSHKGKGKYRLHNRILSENCIEDDKQMVESVKNLHIEDQFGTLAGDQSKINVQKKRWNTDTSDIQFDKVTKQRQSRQRYPSNSKAEIKISFSKKDAKWRNTFGTLSNEVEDSKQELFDEPFDEKDMKPHIRLTSKDRRNDPDWYGRKIEEYGKQGKVKEAIRVLDVWMLQHDRVMPNNFVMSQLLSVLAKAGYTKKAFQVFNQMKKLGIVPNDYIYSALFNACANSPWPEDGLQRASILLQDMAVKDITPNTVTYHSMIKAFAFCGDARTAFLLADKLTSIEKISPKGFSHLLMAAIADKKAGFWYAVQIWRWMLIKRVQPDLKLYNLMLRVMKDCEISDPKLTKLLLSPINPAATLKLLKGEKSGKTEEFLHKRDILSLPSTESTDLKGNKLDDTFPKSESYSFNLQLTESPETLKMTNQEGKNSLDIVEVSTLNEKVPSVKLPNVLKPNEDFSHIISVSDLSTPCDRFAMVGGMMGYLTDMEKYNVTPNVETFDQMLALISPEEEQTMLDFMKSKGVKPDIDLLTNLMYKRCKSMKYSAAKEVLQVITSYKLVPNMRTYSVLAMTCVTLKDGNELLQNIRDAGITPNITVFGALIRRSHLNFYYKKVLLKEMEMEGLKPNTKILQTIEIQLKKARNRILEKEKANEFNTEEYKRFDSNYEDFKKFYQSWLHRMDLDVPEHPWTSFREKKMVETK
ncbi:pentatricopeptide repeat domain-containing protein 1 [Mytilus galloprovincialis]|uniref:Pentatricopeptide repeat domain-containing protein 1 n=1 Tax=Mytilus galloprovincialis TaxID=29158 RepID=A0A8B6EB30_MYTGA|nr:pentatricopeptide repeat domain-containing protein 1 [Mytilus galloprovincialis]